MTNSSKRLEKECDVFDNLKIIIKDHQHVIK